MKRAGRAKAVDEYLAKQPPDRRRRLRALRAQIKAAAPDAVETLSYGMPTYKVDGKPLLPPSARRHLAAKGTIQFAPEDPLPAPVLRKLFRSRLAAIRSGGR